MCYLFIHPRKAIPTGMLSGAMGQFIASPADLVKVRLQMEGKRQLQGLEPRYQVVIAMVTLQYNSYSLKKCYLVHIKYVGVALFQCLIPSLPYLSSY